MNRKTVGLAAGALLVLLVTLGFAWEPMSRWWAVRTSINQIIAGSEIRENRDTLRDMDDRQYVVDKLKDVLDRRTTVAGKMRVLDTLSALNESRVVRRAFHSDEPSTRRAALARMPHAEEVEHATKTKIVLDWIRDDQADMRARAMNTAAMLKIQEAVPVLVEFLDRPPQPGADLTRNAVSALGRLQPDDVVERLRPIAGDEDRDPVVRAFALRAMSHADDAPEDWVGDTAVALLKDRSTTNQPRIIAAGVLDDPRFTSPKTLAALKEVLLATSDPHPIVQRSCLRALGKTAPIEDYQALLLEPRVYDHPYFALRVDVASSLSVLRVKKRLALEILCEYLVYEDEQDIARLVRREAMLSLFRMTGTAYGVPEPEHFQRPPVEIEDKDKARREFFNQGPARYRGSMKRVNAVKQVIGDDAKMARIRQTYLNNIDTFLEAWRKQEKDEDEAAGNGTGEMEAGEPSGPKPPPKDG